MMQKIVGFSNATLEQNMNRKKKNTQRRTPVKLQVKWYSERKMMVQLGPLQWRDKVFDWDECCLQLCRLLHSAPRQLITSSIGLYFLVFGAAARLCDQTAFDIFICFFAVTSTAMATLCREIPKVCVFCTHLIKSCCRALGLILWAKLFLCTKEIWWSSDPKGGGPPLSLGRGSWQREGINQSLGGARDDWWQRYLAGSCISRYKSRGKMNGRDGWLEGMLGGRQEHQGRRKEIHSSLRVCWGGEFSAVTSGIHVY